MYAFVKHDDRPIKFTSTRNLDKYLRMWEDKKYILNICLCSCSGYCIDKPQCKKMYFMIHAPSDSDQPEYLIVQSEP